MTWSTRSNKQSGHKKSSRKVRCPRGAEDDALKIPGAGGLEFDIESGILAITHRTLSKFNTTATCPHPCEQRTVCPQQRLNQLPVQDRLELENQMPSNRCQSLNMFGRIECCISEGQYGFTAETKFFQDCKFHSKTWLHTVDHWNQIYIRQSASNRAFRRLRTITLSHRRVQCS